ncbi:LPXTG cell wall anchor domain-containing protein [Escherichia coli]
MGVGAAPGTAGGGELPRTGGEAPAGVIVLAALLLLLGAGLVLGRRRSA